MKKLVPLIFLLVCAFTPDNVLAQTQLEDADMDLLDYDSKWSRCRIHLKSDGIKEDYVMSRYLITYKYYISR